MFKKNKLFWSFNYYDLSLLVVHGVYFILLVLNKSIIENNFKEQLRKTIRNLNSNNSNITQDCDYMKSLSTYFHCCGYNGTKDFVDKKITFLCCITGKNEPGCAQITIKEIKQKINNLMIVPSSVIFCIEIFFILANIFICLCSNEANRICYLNKV